MSGAMLAGAAALLGLALVLPRGRSAGPGPGSDRPASGPPVARGGAGSGAGSAPGIIGTRLGGARAALAAALAGAGAVVAALGPVTGSVAAAIVTPLTWTGLRALQRRPPPSRADRSLALALDLCAAALRAGRTPADALAAAAPAADPATAQALSRVAGLLRLGAEPARAWAVLDPAGPLGPLAVTAARSADSGLRAAAAFERLAEEVRADCAAAATVRAQRAGVVAIAPLAACFLPSFLCLGVVPVVVGVAESALGTLR